MPCIRGCCQEDSKILRLEIIGNLQKCEYCSLAKAKRKNMSKESGPKSTIPCQRICFERSYVQQKSNGVSKFWLLIVDQCTDMSWSYSLKLKDNLDTTMINFIKDLQTKHGKNKATSMRCDNACENKKF